MSPEEETIIHRSTMKLMDKLYKVLRQRDQYKSENEKLRERNKELEKRCNQKLRRYLRGGLQQRRIVDLESKYNDMKAERDTLIDDLKVLREKNERLEREKKREQAFTEQFKHDLQYTEWEIVPAFQRQNEQQAALLKDFSKFINYKLIISPASDTYKHYRSELDKLGVK